MRAFLFVVLAGCAWAGCVPVETDRITAADLAKAVPGFSGVDPEQPLAFAPIPGAKRMMGGGEIRRIAAHFGIQLVDAQDICFEYPMQELGPDESLAAMRESLTIPDVNIEIVELSRYAVPRGAVTFPKSGLNSSPNATDKSVLLWRGSLAYGKGKHFSIWARVRIWSEGERIVASRDIRPGEGLSEKDLTVSRVRYFPGSEVRDDRSALVGRIAKVRLPAGSPISPLALQKKREVVRGSPVAVAVASDSVHLSFRARAETDGRLGEAVQILNPATGRRFSAVVNGPNSVVVEVAANEK